MGMAGSTKHESFKRTVFLMKAVRFFQVGPMQFIVCGK